MWVSDGHPPSAVECSQLPQTRDFSNTALLEIKEKKNKYRWKLENLEIGYRREFQYLKELHWTSFEILLYANFLRPLVFFSTIVLFVPSLLQSYICVTCVGTSTWSIFFFFYMINLVSHCFLCRSGVCLVGGTSFPTGFVSYSNHFKSSYSFKKPGHLFCVYTVLFRLYSI